MDVGGGGGGGCSAAIVGAHGHRLLDDRLRNDQSIIIDSSMDSMLFCAQIRTCQPRATVVVVDARDEQSIECAERVWRELERHDGEPPFVMLVIVNWHASERPLRKRVDALGAKVSRTAEVEAGDRDGFFACVAHAIRRSPRK